MGLVIKGKIALVCAASKGLAEPAPCRPAVSKSTEAFITGQNFLMDGGTYPGTH